MDCAWTIIIWREQQQPKTKQQNLDATASAQQILT